MAPQYSFNPLWDLADEIRNGSMTVSEAEAICKDRRDVVRAVQCIC